MARIAIISNTGTPLAAGNDATGQRGDGSLPFLTLQAGLDVAQEGDEIWLAGTFLLTAPASRTNTPDGLTVTAHPDGRTNPVIRGDGARPTWSVFAAPVYRAPMPMSGCAGVTLDYETSLDALGRRRCYLQPRASVAELTGGQAGWFADSKDVYVRLPDGGSPNGRCGVVMAANVLTLDAPAAGGSSLIVQDIHFGASIYLAEGQGYCLYQRQWRQSTTRRCRFESGGWHCMGYAGFVCDHNTVEDSAFITCMPTAGMAVMYAGQEDVVGCRILRSSFLQSAPVDPDGNPIAATGTAPIYTHTGGSTQVTDLLIDQCEFRAPPGALVSNRPMVSGNDVAGLASDFLNFDAYPLRIDRSIFRDTAFAAQTIVAGQAMAIRRCFIEGRLEGANAHASRSLMNIKGPALIEACNILLVNQPTQAGQDAYILTNDSGRITALNNRMEIRSDSSFGAAAALRPSANSVAVEARGNHFVRGGTNGGSTDNTRVVQDSFLAIANWTMRGNAYSRFTRYGGTGSTATQANFQLNAEPASEGAYDQPGDLIDYEPDAAQAFTGPGFGTALEQLALPNAIWSQTSLNDRELRDHPGPYGSGPFNGGMLAVAS